MAADQDDIRADVLRLLQNFRGIEPMKELFCSHLNYERVSMPSRSVSILRLSIVRFVDAREQQAWPPPLPRT